MKRHVISTVIALAILVVAWTAFGQEQEKSEQGQQMEGGRQREISEGQIEKLVEAIRYGGFVSPEERQKCVKAIEEQLAKLKVTQGPLFEGNVSREKLNEVKEELRKSMQDQRQALQIITEQVARLQGRRQPEGEGERYLIVSTVEIKQIQEAATREKAEETSELLERLIASGGRSLRGRRPRGERSQGGE